MVCVDQALELRACVSVACAEEVRVDGGACAISMVGGEYVTKPVVEFLQVDIASPVRCRLDHSALPSQLGSSAAGSRRPRTIDHLIGQSAPSMRLTAWSIRHGCPAS